MSVGSRLLRSWPIWLGCCVITTRGLAFRFPFQERTLSDEEQAEISLDFLVLQTAFALQLLLAVLLLTSTIGVVLLVRLSLQPRFRGLTDEMCSLEKKLVSRTLPDQVLEKFGRCINITCQEIRADQDSFFRKPASNAITSNLTSTGVRADSRLQTDELKQRTGQTTTVIRRTNSSANKLPTTLNLESVVPPAVSPSGHK